MPADYVARHGVLSWMTDVPDLPHREDSDAPFDTHPPIVWSRPHSLAGSTGAVGSDEDSLTFGEGRSRAGSDGESSRAVAFEEDEDDDPLGSVGSGQYATWSDRSTGDPDESPNLFTWFREDDVAWAEQVKDHRVALDSARATMDEKETLGSVLRLQDLLWKHFWQKPIVSSPELDEVIALCREALALLDIEELKIENVARRKRCLSDLAFALCARARLEKENGDPNQDLQDAYAFHQEAESLSVPDFAPRRYPLHPLALETSQKLSHIEHVQHVTTSYPLGPEAEPALAIIRHSSAYRQQKGMALEEVVEDVVRWHRESLPHIREERLNTISFLSSYQDALWKQFWRTPNQDDIVTILSSSEELISLFDETNSDQRKPSRSILFATIAAAWYLSNELRGTEFPLQDERVQTTLHHAFTLGYDGHLPVLDVDHELASRAREALSHLAEETTHNEYPESGGVKEKEKVMTLADDILNIWFLRADGARRAGKEDLRTWTDTKLDKAISCCQDAIVQRWPTTNDERLLMLSEKCSFCLFERYLRTFSSADLTACITQLYHIRRFFPEGDPCRLRLDTELALAYTFRHEYSEKKIRPLEAKSTWMGVLENASQNDALRAICLSGLAYAIEYRYLISGDEHDLQEATRLGKEALDLCRPDTIEYIYCLHFLIPIFRQKATVLPDHDIIREAINLSEDFISQCPRRYFFYRECVLHLASMLEMQYLYDGDLDCLRRAEDIIHQELKSNTSHTIKRAEFLHQLARIQFARFRATNNEVHMSEALTQAFEVINTASEEHAHRATYLAHLATLLLQSSPKRNVAQAIQFLSQAVQYPHQSIRPRFEAVVDVMDTVEFRTSTREVVSRSERLLLLKLYEQVLDMVPTVAASVGLNTDERLDRVRRFETYASDAAVHWLLVDQPSRAVETLESGRAIFWQQSLRLRTRFDDMLLDKRLSAFESPLQELSRASAWLERFGHQGALPLDEDPEMPGGVTWGLEDAVERRQWLTDRFYEILQDIRANVPGYERFLLPAEFETLARCSYEGPIVLFVASEIQCYAVVVASGSALSVGLPESLTLERLQKLGGVIKEDAIRVRSGGMPTEVDNDMAQTVPNDHVRAMGVSWPKRIDKSKSYLETLWKDIMKPIVRALGLCVVQGRNRPRVWLCPTGPFTFLPLHAAGVNKGETLHECCSDFMVISYIPSIGALLNARKDMDQVLTLEEHKVLVAAVPSPPTDAHIPNAENEVSVLKALIPVESLIKLPGSNIHACIGPVLAALPDTSFLHLACHGQQNTINPLESGFVMQDGVLSISMLMKVDLKHAFFAFLSACETAKGDVSQPNQAIHLAAAMLFCGFRSILATMWTMNDFDGPTVTKAIYEELFSSTCQRFDAASIPFALDAVVRTMREAGVPAARWATYIHVGV